jgi:hypothetical protein
MFMSFILQRAPLLGHISLLCLCSCGVAVVFSRHIVIREERDACRSRGSTGAALGVLTVGQRLRVGIR